MIKLDSRSEKFTFTQSGLSCRVDRFIPPFTEMTVTISLPGEGNKQKEISCKGAVIRCSREAKNKYRILLYFLDIDEDAIRGLAPFSAGPKD